MSINTSPMLALQAINPSLVGYMGGWGKAAQALGGSMEKIGQARLDLEEKQALKDEKTKVALDLKNSNIATNRMIVGTYGDKNTYGDEELAMYKPENLRAIGKDGWELQQTKAKEQKSAATELARIDYMMKDKPDMFNGTTREQVMAIGLDNYLKPKETTGGLITNIDGTTSVRDAYGTTKPLESPKAVFVPEAVKKQTMFIDGKPVEVATNILTGESKTLSLPMGALTDDQKARQESLNNSLNLQDNQGKITKSNQSHAAKLQVVTAPEIADLKSAKEVENMFKTLHGMGFTKELTPGEVSFYKAKAPEGSFLNVQEVKANGVTTYLTKPNNVYTHSKK